jgi:hypothetical protein
MKQTAILFLLFLNAFYLNAQKGTLQGTILDSKTSDPLIGATVKIVNSDKGTATDLDGFFSIPNIEVGSYSVEISYVSFKTEILNDIKIEADKITELKINLSEESKTLEEVVVTAERIKNNEIAILSEIKPQCR